MTMALLRGIQKSTQLTKLCCVGQGWKASLPITSCQSSTVAKAQLDMKNHWIKNETVKRPISPHLTIWKWQLPMNCSLGHRVTGCAMTTALYCFSYGIFMLPGDYATYLNMIKDMNLGPALISSAKFVLAFPLAYHTLNGMRHLSWDLGKGLEMKTIYKSGWSAIFGGVILAALMTQL